MRRQPKTAALENGKMIVGLFFFFSSSPHSPSSSVLISLSSPSRKFQLGTSSNLAHPGDGMSHCFHVETSRNKLSSDCDTDGV